MLPAALLPDALRSPAEFRAVVSGRRKGVTASILRGAFAAAEVGYRAGVAWRNRGFDNGTREVERVSAPVLSVGNLTLGGTGKTPMVEWLAKWFRRQDVRPAIVSRGYGAGASGVNDEALVLEANLPDVPHIQDPYRAAAARVAIEELASQLILLDDGFQHRRLHRDFDLVLLDALEPFGFGRLFPRGTLREPAANLRRAQAVGLSRADLISPAEREEIRAQAMRQAPHAAWFEVTHQPCDLHDADQTVRPLAELADRRVLAFCGLGNPEGFKRTLASLGCEPAAFIEFPDHHRYTRDDVLSLEQSAAEHRAEWVVCTQKDLVKLSLPTLGGRPLLALRITTQFLAGQAELEARLAPLVEAARLVEEIPDLD